MGLDLEKLIPERYRAKYDKKNDRWVIADLWHPQIKNLPELGDNIPEDSPALNVCRHKLFLFERVRY